MSRLVSVELLGTYKTDNSLDSFVNFFRQQNIQFLYSNRFSVEYFYNDDTEINYLDINNIQDISIKTIFVTYTIENKKYSIGFGINNPKKLDILFNGVKRIDGEYADFTWVYKNILKKIHENLFSFYDITYFDLR